MPEVPAWIESLGRFGHFAKGLVYFIMGFLAFKLAIGAGGEIAGARDAIREIGQQPFGRFLLGLVAIGLLGYFAWRAVQAGKDTDGVGNGVKGVCKRIGYAVSGVAYLSLGCFAGSLALGWSSGGNGSQGGAASPLLESTWGRIALGLAGAVTVAVACYFFYKAYRAKFMTKYELSAMSETTRKLALHAGRTGISTRGIAFAIIGGFILMSAIRGTSDGEIAGMSDALAAIAAQTYGKILIGITGFGLMCYAVHMLLMGWYRRFNVK
ncbi:DUF1206 domain-containing protein [Stieleria mannarensis]|uniref:DUF1206 domain-containing protein n=1 Tax=Stieleria mannarensis TaxID=2755585 RepID=UPI00256FEB21|nr:DUF1206 domain-containing protein [Rhodopirellula sp. JC639]